MPIRTIMTATTTSTFHVHRPGEAHDAPRAHAHVHAAFWVGRCTA
jgi:hypothetical protein